MSHMLRIDLEMTLAEALEAAQGTLRRPGMLKAAGTAIDTASGLVTPALIYDSGSRWAAEWSARPR